MEIVHSIVDIWMQLLPWLAGMGVGFTLLSYLTPCNRGQSFWRKDLITDILYFFIAPIFNRFASILFISIGLHFLFQDGSQNFQEFVEYGRGGPISELPIWLQAAVMFIIADVLLYWIHRIFHGKNLWRFHAIHHSSPQLDWLSTYRFHPINTWFAFTLVDTTMLMVGFSPAAQAALAGFNMLYSAMVHANLNWTFGPFKYLFASPVFHRWHHTSQEEGMDKNFAPTFPLLDIVFGTFYMPENRIPEHYGVPGANIPNGFIGQLIWPFKKQR